MSTITILPDSPQQKLLGEYTFQSVEDESEEKVVEKYSREGKEYTLTVDKQSGKKHGKAELADESLCVIAKMTFDQGNLTGPCVICNTRGIPQFKGFLKNGVKDGKCTEYDNFNNIIFCGCYREGKKIPFFESITDKPGFFLERSEDCSRSISYTQYNPKENKKYGQCFVLNSSGEVEKELNVDNGKEVIVRELKENIMIVYENGEKVYEGCFSGDWKSGYKRQGDGKEFENGILVYEGEFVNDKRNVVIGECKDSNFVGYFEEKTTGGKLISISQMKQCTLIKHGRSIGFSTQNGNAVSEKWYEDGKVKWERVRVNGKDMTELDEGGNMLYKGEFKLLDGEFVRWGEGQEFEGGNIVLYKGGFQNGFYDGEGVLYRNNQAYLNGNWKCGYPEGEGVLYDDDLKVKMKGNWHLGYLDGIDYLTGEKWGFCSCFGYVRGKDVEKRMVRITEEEERERREREERERREREKRFWNEELRICAGLNFKQARGIEELKIGDNSFNESCDDLSKMKMNLSEFKKLKRIEIGNDCFKHVREFVIDGLESLESVKIGEWCFRIDWKERDDGICRITNCPNLRQLEIGHNSFRDFKSFEISNLNSVQSIKFGDYCFQYADFSLKGE